MATAIVQNSDLTIVYTYDSVYPEFFDRPDELTHIKIPEGINKFAVKADRDPVNGQIILVKDEEKHETVVALQWKNIRNERNRRLAECDWTRLDDVLLDSTQRDKWAIYRQMLRDVPVVNSDPFAIEWPTVPS